MAGSTRHGFMPCRSPIRPKPVKQNLAPGPYTSLAIRSATLTVAFNPLSTHVWTWTAPPCKPSTTVVSSLSISSSSRSCPSQSKTQYDCQGSFKSFTAIGISNAMVLLLELAVSRTPNAGAKQGRSCVVHLKTVLTTRDAHTMQTLSSRMGWHAGPRPPVSRCIPVLSFWGAFA